VNASANRWWNGCATNSELEVCRRRLLASSPLSTLPYHRQRVDGVTDRMIRALQRRCEVRRSEVESRRQRIAASSN
jgi:hypothetical protein